ncbi:Putative tetratricopeptide-like helical domain superfamily [Septoria linicola]|uniref:Tetratricopeptide-like helical domain superfamily n=1 Tax=Septoria linicola TaxID=215465 RepID=A0A9Q9ERI6_9PEZI|nr:Putative tetratricopeptide-like helical domain superfamily [Septoria linicola]
MPSCCLAFRTLCRNPRLHTPSPSARVLQWQQHHHLHHQQSSHSTSGRGFRSDDSQQRPAVNLNKVTADSAYLDFLLGSDDVEPSERRVSSNEHILSGTCEHDREQHVVEASTEAAAKPRTPRRARGVMARQQPAQRPHKPLKTVSESPKERLHALHARVEAHASSSIRTGSRPEMIRRVHVAESIGRHGATRVNDLKGNNDRTELLGHQLRREDADPRPGKHVVLPDSQRPRSWSIRNWMRNVKSLYSYIPTTTPRSHTTSRPRSSTASPDPTPPTLSPLVFDLVDEVYNQLELSSADNLQSLFSKHRGQWPHVLLWFLHYDPTGALNLLIATNISSKTQGRLSILYRQESLRCLATIYWYRGDIPNLKRLADAFIALTRFAHSTSQVGTHGFVYRALSDHFGDEALSAVYGDLKRFHHRQVHWATWLRFAITFSKRQKGGQALDALLESKHAGADVDGLSFRKVCSILLRKAVSMPGGLRACIRIVDAMFKIGLTLNSNLANIIMLNAVEAGDIKTAMDIYHSLRDHGLQPDQYTFAILLKACKISIDDADVLNNTIRTAIGGINVLDAPIVATEILHCLALHHTRTNYREKVFHTVADAYAQLFTVGPLRLVGLLPDGLSQVDRHRDGNRPQPRAQDIYIVLSTFLEQSFFRDKSVAAAYETWQRFKHVIEAGEEPFASMLANEAGAKYHRMRPTVQTWSIFLHGFTRHGQLRLAEQVLTYMRSKDIKPNTITYNSLLSGYISERDLEGVLDTIRRMETDGLTWDEWTRKYLSRSRDKAAIEAEIRKNTEWRSLDFTADLKQNLENRIEAFAPRAQVHVRAESEGAVTEHDMDAQPQTSGEHESEQERIAEAYFDDERDMEPRSTLC